MTGKREISKETIQLVLGLKVRHLRQQLDLTLQQLADRSGTTLSFLHDIEKGKKHPSPDKLLALAKALECDYDYLVSPQSNRKLQPLIELLESEFMRSYPLEMFGIEPAFLVELLSKYPEKISAFVSTLLKIVRNYHLSRENIYNASLRAYQDMHSNYFPELEERVRVFRQENGLEAGRNNLRAAQLEGVLAERFGIRTDRAALPQQALLQGLRAYFSEKNKVFYLGKNLTAAQEVFLLARELGFLQLQLSPRPFEMPSPAADNFEVLLHQFQASYFASALLMDEHLLAADLRETFENPRWDAAAWLLFLKKYGVTAETFFQRLTNILPHHFGISNLFFIRINGNRDLNEFQMTKELHLSGQQSPYASETGEHYCRRWLSIGTLRTLRAAGTPAGEVICDAQLSQYHDSDKTYLCLSMAKSEGQTGQGVSVTLGLLLDSHLRRTVQFADDPGIRRKMVNTVCEQCGIVDCGARVAPPVFIEMEEKRRQVEAELARL